MRFLGLGPGDSVPDAKTIWLLWEHLTQAGVVDNLFARFDKHLTGAGKVPDEWKDKPAKLRQKDRDARWTVKFSKAKMAEDGKAQHRDIAIPAFGYKNHAAIDRRHGFIRGWKRLRL